MQVLFTAVKDTLPSIPGEHNYIYVRTPLEENEEKNYDEITFYDGLGRELDCRKLMSRPYRYFYSPPSPDRI